MLPGSKFLLNKLYPKRNYEFFYGRIYHLGEAAVSVRNTKHKPHYTVITVNGFLADHRYYTQLYADVEIELILQTNSGYHVPVAQKDYEIPEWYQPIPYEHATIEYDAAALCQAVEHLPTTDNIRVHGHSRGGAVVVEAANQRPDLFANVEVVLEAPILPQTRRHRALGIWAKRPLLYLAPYYGTLLRDLPQKLHDYAPLFGDLGSRERKLLGSMTSSPKDFQAVLNNVESFEEWARVHPLQYCNAIKHGYVVIPQADKVLDRKSMLATAQYCAPGVEIIHAPARSHFVTTETPDAIPPVKRRLCKVDFTQASKPTQTAAAA